MTTMKWLGLSALACALVACGSADENNQTSTTTSSTSAAGGNGTGGNGSGGNSAGGAAAGGSDQGGNDTGGTSAAGGAGQGGNGSVGGAGQGGSTQGQPCMWSPNNSCPQGEYCNAPGCGAGTCTPIANLDTPVKAEVCGCDGVSYWNTDTAATHGMAVAGSGSCTPQKFCGGFANIACPDPNHFCDYDVMNKNGCNISDAGGTCWGMPATCGQISIGGQQRQCFAPNGPCLDECDAIKTQQPHFTDNTCPQ